MKYWFRGVDEVDCYGLRVKKKMVKPTWISHRQAINIMNIIKYDTMDREKLLQYATHEYCPYCGADMTLMSSSHLCERCESRVSVPASVPADFIKLLRECTKNVGDIPPLRAV